MDIDEDSDDDTTELIERPDANVKTTVEIEDSDIEVIEIEREHVMEE